MHPNQAAALREPAQLHIQSDDELSHDNILRAGERYEELMKCCSFMPYHLLQSLRLLTLQHATSAALRWLRKHDALMHTAK
jgi:hypothetical protein